MARAFVSHSSHWGAFEAEVADGTVVAIRPYEHDPDPSPLLGNIVDSLRHQARIAQPMIRAGWFDRGPGADARRGAEPFVPTDWDMALALVSAELTRVKTAFGNSAIFGGSYGWSSAGRLHHAKSLLHRFMNAFGGATMQVDTYSNAAGSVITPHVLGDATAISGPSTTFDRCMDRYGRDVALLHDYGLWEFTVLVRFRA